MKVLLTGAAGFIGSRVGAALRDSGHGVVPVDATLPAAHGPDAPLPPECRRVDVRDGEALGTLLAGVDVVCHQAASVGAGVDTADARNTPATTTMAPRCCLPGCSPPGCPGWCWRRR